MREMAWYVQQQMNCMWTHQCSSWSQEHTLRYRRWFTRSPIKENIPGPLQLVTVWNEAVVLCVKWWDVRNASKMKCEFNPHIREIRFLLLKLWRIFCCFFVTTNIWPTPHLDMIKAVFGTFASQPFLPSHHYCSIIQFKCNNYLNCLFLWVIWLTIV